MKKLGIFGILLLGALGIVEASTIPVKMVTYFPAPYVAYSRLGPENVLTDLSIVGRNDYFLRVGTADYASPNVPLYVQTLLLQKPKSVGYRTKLELTANDRFAISSDLVRAGSSQSLRSVSGNPATTNPGDQRKIRFKQNLQITQQPVGSTFYSVNAEVINVPNLYLFGLKVPECNNTETSGDRHRISWRAANIHFNTNQAMSGVFLSCGDKETCHCDGWAWHETYPQIGSGGCAAQEGAIQGDYVDCRGACHEGDAPHYWEECTGGVWIPYTCSCEKCDSSWDLCQDCIRSGWGGPCDPNGGGGGTGGGVAPGQQDDDIKEKEKNL